MKMKEVRDVRRGLIAARAETNPAAVLAELQGAWATFQSKHDEQLKEIKKGYEDVVRSEELTKINSSITAFQTAIDEMNAKVAAMNVGAGAGDGKKRSPDQVAYSAAFEKFFRKGDQAEAGLRELEVKAAATVNSDPDGGYTVRDEMETAIDRVLGLVSPMRGLATVRQIGGAAYKKLVTTSGVSSGWVGETEGRPGTDTPKLSELAFPAMELYAMPAATQSLLDDSVVNIDQWLADEVSMEFAEQEGDAFINGTGVKQPHGLLSYTKVANASYAWGKIGYVASGSAGAFAASDPADKLIDLVHSLKRGYRQNASWLMNDATVGVIRKFKDGDHQYLWQPSLQVGQPSTFLGYALESDDFMPDIGSNAFPIAFGDFRRAYVIVDRVGTRVLRDPYTNKPYVLFYTTKRVGGGVQNFEAVKLFKTAAS